MTAQLVITDITGAKHVEPMPSVERAMTRAQQIMTPDARSLREVKIVGKRSRVVARWRPAVVWRQVPTR